MTGSALKDRRPSWTACPGTGQPPTRVVNPAHFYRLASTGQMHESPGTGICSHCGRTVAYRERAGIVRHKAI